MGKWFFDPTQTFPGSTVPLCISIPAVKVWPPSLEGIACSRDGVPGGKEKTARTVIF